MPCRVCRGDFIVWWFSQQIFTFPYSELSGGTDASPSLFWEGRAIRGSKMAWNYVCSPHNDLDDLHGCITQGVEEIHQDLSLFTHFPNDESKDQAEDNQAQDIDAVRILAHDGVFLCPVLWIQTKKIDWYMIILLLKCAQSWDEKKKMKVKHNKLGIYPGMINNISENSNGNKPRYAINFTPPQGFFLFSTNPHLKFLKRLFVNVWTALHFYYKF